MADKKTAEEIATELNAKIDTFKEMVEKSATVEALNIAVASFDDFKEKNDTTGFEEKMSNLQKDIIKLNEKVGKISINDNPGGADLATKIKQAFDTDQWKQHLENRAEGQSPIYQLKDITWGAAAAAGTNDVVHNAMPFTIPQYPFEEPFDVRSIVPTGTVDTGSLDYPKELLYTDNMSMEGETDAAAETTITFEMVTETAHRIATFAEVSRRALRNTAWLSQYLANRFMEKFVKLLNTQVLVGDGTGDNLTGITNQSGILTFRVTSTSPTMVGYADIIPVGESTLIDAILAMQSQLYDISNVKGNAVFVSPLTKLQLTLQKTTTREYAYDQQLAQVAATGMWQIGGMNLIESKDIADGDALVGLIAPTVLQTLFNGGIDMATTEAHASNFIASKVAFRFEADILFPVYRPYAFIKGTLATVQTAITASA